MSRIPRTLLISLLFVGCAAPAPKTLNVPRPQVDATLGPGDLFDVRVFEEPDLSNSFRVDPEGYIDYPLIGKVAVNGLLPGELVNVLQAKLSSFVRKPGVSVLVREVNSKRVIVYGQVQRPGTFPYTDAMTISRVISLAGGFTAMAARERVLVSRTERDKQHIIQIDARAISSGLAANQYVLPGDEVFVPERLF